MQCSNTNTLTMYEATTFLQRLRGLLGRSELSESEALHIEPCADVHSFGMKYSLDIVFLSEAGEVLQASLLKPNSWVRHKGAQSVIEFRAGCAERNGIVVGGSFCTSNSRTIGERK